MPALDEYHHVVITALKEDGWTIISDQVALILEYRRLWVDLKAEREESNVVILVEVKSFFNVSSPIEYLSGVVGKYRLYSTALDLLKIDIPLYLAVPKHAYDEILSEDIGQALVEDAKINLVIFDPLFARILQWIPHWTQFEK